MSGRTDTPTAPPYLTAALPGVGGVIKRYDEDFIVEEVPRYPASGQGTHVYFVIQKRGLTTLAAIRIIARSLGKNPRDIGYAGMKDAHGVTRQMLSVEHVDPERVASLDLTKIRVLSVDRHTNKIKLGHLAGNRFAIKVRDTVPSPLVRAQAILAVLESRGVPNYFGSQRFGVRGDNALIGRALIRNDYHEAIALMLGRPGPADQGGARRARELFDAGDLEGSASAWPGRLSAQARVCRVFARSGRDARAAWRAVDHTLRKLYVSAVQSELFNRVLLHRVTTIDHLEEGDIAWKHANGACFQVEDPAGEQPRCDAFEISPTGPLFGRKMTEARGEPGRLEEEVLSDSGLSREELRTRDGTKLDGVRRPLRVPVTDPRISETVDDGGACLNLTFSLGPGAYATSVIREICKVDTPPAPSASPLDQPRR